jgi:hypothetical protein
VCQRAGGVTLFPLLRNTSNITNAINARVFCFYKVLQKLGYRFEIILKAGLCSKHSNPAENQELQPWFLLEQVFEGLDKVKTKTGGKPTANLSNS